MEYFSLRKFRIDCYGRYGKIRLAMRLTTILLLATALQVSARSEGQTISLSGNNISLTKALTEIKNQSKYAFFWSDQLVGSAPSISVRFKNYSLQQALDAVLKDLPFSYRIENNFVYISPKMNHSASPALIIQEQHVHGKVTDSANHPLSGVAVTIKGTTRGTITNADGNFDLEAKKGDVLQFNYVGFKISQITVGNEDVVNIVLEVQNNFQNDVVVVGYSTQKRQDITAAIATVSSRDLESSRSGATVSAGLAGKAPGISFLMQDSRPGAAANIQIRNYGNPIYIIDGVKQITPSQNGDFPIASTPFNNLSPADIESITFLKDASAAVYGVQAANGVVLITTKRGKSGTPNVNISINNGWQNWTRFPKMANNYQWQESRVEAYVNAGQDPSSNGLPPSELAKYKAATTSAAADTGQYRSFDWYKFIVHPGAPQGNQSINLSGGTDKINFYTALSHLKQDGLFNVGSGRQFTYERTNFQGNVEAKISNGIKAGTEVNGNVEKRQNPGIPNVDDYQNALTALYLLKPWQRPYANDNPNYLNNLGNVNSYNFAFFTFDNSGKYTATTWSLQTNFHVDWQTPLKGLSFRGLYSYYYSYYLINNLENVYNVYNYLPATQTYQQAVGSANPWRQRDEDLLTKSNTQLQANYANSFGKHNVQATFVNERISSLERYTFVHSIPPIPKLDLITFQAMDTYTDRQLPVSTIGYVGNINYNYDEKYYLQLMGRRDASYVLSPGHKWGNFTAVTGGWRISKEKFFEKLVSPDIVNNLKINASYGTTGDDRPIIDLNGGTNDANGINNQFNYLNNAYNYPGGTVILNGNSIPTATFRGVAQTNLTWVTAKTLNIGIDFVLFNNKLSGSIEYFNRKTVNIPDNRPVIVLPLEIGYSLSYQNQDSARVRGFELNLDYRTKIHEVNFSVSGNIAYARSVNLGVFNPTYNNSLDNYFNNPYDRLRITQLNNTVVNFSGANTNDATYNNFGYIAAGQFQSQEQINNWKANQDGQGNRTLRPGDIIYKDLNGDGVIDQKDTRPIGYGANSSPMLYGGLSFTAAYKGFDLRIDFSGGSLFSFYRNTLLSQPFNNQGNVLTELYNSHWHHQDIYDPNSPWVPGKYPSFSYPGDAGSSNNYRLSSFWNTNVWYIKCRNIEMGYNLPKEWLSVIHLRNIRAYVNISNLFSLDNVHQFGIDPESRLNSGQWVSYPALRVINVGANITL